MILEKLLRRLSHYYFSAEVRGLENIPEGPCLLVGNHSGIGLLNPEIWIFGTSYLEKHNRLAVLGHDLVLRVPGIAQLAVKFLRYIPNNFESARAALQRGKHVLVYPGGSWESCRPWRDRDKIDFKNRTGYLKLAREAGVSIVPVVAAGAHDGLFVWSRGEKIARALRLHRFFRIDVFPLGLSFPFFIHVGPIWPFIPFPRKVIVEVLPAMVVNERADEVERKMQEALTKNAGELRR